MSTRSPVTVASSSGTAIRLGSASPSLCWFSFDRRTRCSRVVQLPIEVGAFAPLVDVLQYFLRFGGKRECRLRADRRGRAVQFFSNFLAEPTERLLFGSCRS